MIYYLAGGEVWVDHWCSNEGSWLLLWSEAEIPSNASVLFQLACMLHPSQCCLLQLPRQVRCLNFKCIEQWLFWSAIWY